MFETTAAVVARSVICDTYNRAVYGLQERRGAALDSTRSRYLVVLQYTQVELDSTVVPVLLVGPAS